MSREKLGDKILHFIYVQIIDKNTRCMSQNYIFYLMMMNNTEPIFITAWGK